MYSYRYTTILNNKRTTTKVIYIPPVPRLLNRNKTEKDLVVFNRLTLNKMLAEKQIPSDNHYSWLSKILYNFTFLIRYLRSQLFVNMFDCGVAKNI